MKNGNMEIEIGPSLWDNIVGVFIWSPLGMFWGLVNTFVAFMIAREFSIPLAIVVWIGTLAICDYGVYQIIMWLNEERHLHDNSINGKLPFLDDLPELPLHMCNGSGNMMTCHICGEPVNILRRVKIVERGYRNGNPWAVADIWWQCPHNHRGSPGYYDNLERYEVRNTEWISSTWGICHF